jgi:hypothetical protein
MALNFDLRGLPECCGIGLVPGEPHTDCPRCHARYNTALLAQGINRVRRGESSAIPAGFALIQTPDGYRH